ncbi:hypothetical protein B0H19DRAFT_975617, partial [Mycena capillaripes]
MDDVAAGQNPPQFSIPCSPLFPPERGVKTERKAIRPCGFSSQIMSTTSSDSDSTILSDNDRLIAVLQMCFNDLIRKQEDQGERLYRAVEALKPQAPATDKKTTFWNSYLKLADEHDKEFEERYGTDLDTALIFAGLFSAVGSAFIIQIQPQLTVPNPPKIIVVVQSMLYISLFTTLLAALLAVLGKQWIMYYQAAGSRGTIEERG